MDTLAALPPMPSVSSPVPPHFQQGQWAALLRAALFSPAVCLQVQWRRGLPVQVVLSGPPRSLELAAQALPGVRPVLTGPGAWAAALPTVPGGPWYEVRRQKLVLPTSSPLIPICAALALPAGSSAQFGDVQFGAVEAQWICLERVSVHGERASVRQQMRDLPAPPSTHALLAAWAEELREPHLSMRHYTLFAAPAPNVLIPAGLEIVQAFAAVSQGRLSPLPGRWAHLIPDRWAAALLPTPDFASCGVGSPGH